jgi:hypothetical protein
MQPRSSDKAMCLTLYQADRKQDSGGCWNDEKGNSDSAYICDCRLIRRWCQPPCGLQLHICSSAADWM